jgi:hypothetical protein
MSLLPVPNVPVLTAISVGEPKMSGRTKPISMWCASADGSEQADYVIKLYGNVELGTRSLARELFAALLGQAMCFSIPAVAIVNISPDLIQSAAWSSVSDHLRKSPGYNFGSRTLQTPITFQRLPSELIQQAANVFAFDMLLQNPDRRKGKPNMFQDSEDLILYDHEMAFPYAAPGMLLMPQVEPWSLARTDPMVTNHILYNALRGNGEINFDGFLEHIEELTDDILDQIAERVPSEWRSSNPPEIDNICAYLRKARDHIDLFRRCLLEVIA